MFVDGQQRHESVIPMRWRSSQAFELEGAHCVVTTEPTGLMSTKFCTFLEINGESIKPHPGLSFWKG